jgi:hypothetical protein
MTDIKLHRKPLAFGMTEWHGLPGTTAHLFWGGPGDGLYFVRNDNQQRIRHASASGVYDTVKAADKAARAFVAAYEAEEE